MNDFQEELDKDKKKVLKENEHILKMKLNELWKEITYKSLETKIEKKLPEWRIYDILPYLSSLLINLSEQAEKQTKRIINLTYWLLAVTAMLLAFEVYKYCETNIKTKGNQTELNKEINSMPVKPELTKTETKQKQDYKK